jgi:IS30 family transposase
VKFGRKQKLTPAKLAHAKRLLKENKPVPDIAALLDVSPSTIYRRCDVRDGWMTYRELGEAAA